MIAVKCSFDALADAMCSQPCHDAPETEDTSGESIFTSSNIISFQLNVSENVVRERRPCQFLSRNILPTPTVIQSELKQYQWGVIDSSELRVAKRRKYLPKSFDRCLTA